MHFFLANFRTEIFKILVLKFHAEISNTHRFNENQKISFNSNILPPKNGGFKAWPHSVSNANFTILSDISGNTGIQQNHTNLSPQQLTHTQAQVTNKGFPNCVGNIWQTCQSLNKYNEWNCKVLLQNVVIKMWTI